MDELPPVIAAPTPGPALSNADLINGKRLQPIKVVGTYDHTEFEQFIQEWAYGYLAVAKGEYSSVHRLGGAGDKGRDIVACVASRTGVVDYYQCKHYGRALTPSDALIEIGKILYYAHTKEISFPRKCIFVASKDVTTALSDLFLNPEKLKQKLIKDWVKMCSKKIIDTQEVSLDADFLEYISAVDFSVFIHKPIIEVISEHSTTVWATPRFGGGLKPRPKVDDAPALITEVENRYVEQLLEAYSDKNQIKIDTPADLSRYVDEGEHFKRQRNAFYSAEALRIYARESLPPELDAFGALKKDIHDAVIDTSKKTYQNGLDRADAVIDKAVMLPVDSNLLANQTRSLDKQGICHHLANEDKLTWVPKKHEK